MKKKFFYLLAVSLILFLLDRWGKLDFFHRLFLNLTGQSRQKAVVLRGEKRESCEGKLADLELKIARLEEENRASRRLLGADLSPKLKFIPGQLLGLSNDSFLLNIGRENEIETGALVVWENILVGKINRVASFTSEGVFVNNRRFRLAVGIWRATGEKATREKYLVGKGLFQGGPTLIIEEILPEEEVEKGDLVADLETAGQFIIGRVNEVGLDEGKVFKKATVDWLANPRQMETVFVVKE